VSLLEEIKDQNQKRKLGTVGPKHNNEDNKKSMVLQSSELVAIVRQVLDLNQIDAKTRKAWKHHRSRLRSAKWELAHTLGNVSAALFANQIGLCLEHMEKNISHSQGNGQWKLAEYEVDIRKDSNNMESVMLACKWVDALNKDDLQYHNGAPAMNVNVKAQALPTEVLDALAAKGDSSNDSELKSLLKDLIGVMAKEKVSTDTFENVGKEKAKPDTL
tara:strand:- start:3892 stop:4542 length:651 start_codon:yes stop_codon:yes gene_type:complete